MQRCFFFDFCKDSASLSVLRTAKMRVSYSLSIWLLIKPRGFTFIDLIVRSSIRNSSAGFSSPIVSEHNCAEFVILTKDFDSLIRPTPTNYDVGG